MSSYMQYYHLVYNTKPYAFGNLCQRLVKIAALHPQMSTSVDNCTQPLIQTKALTVLTSAPINLKLLHQWQVQKVLQCCNFDLWYSESQQLKTMLNLQLMVNFLSAVSDSSRVNGRSYHRCRLRFTYRPENIKDKQLSQFKYVQIV